MPGFEPEILRLQTGVIPMSYTRPNFKPPSLMGSEAEQDVLYCCFVTISLLAYRTLLKNDGRESLPFIQGPNLFKIYVYCSIHIYIYIYIYQQFRQSDRSGTFFTESSLFSWWPEPTFQNKRIQSSSYMFKSPRSFLSESEPKRPGFETLNKKENV